MRLRATGKWVFGALCAVGLVVWLANSWPQRKAHSTTPTPIPAASPCPTDQERWLGDAFWKHADVEEVDARLECGADIKQVGIGARSALHVAAGFTTNPAVIQLLLNRGADIEAKGPFATTPLHWAAANQNPAVIRILLDRGANTEVQRKDSGETPLHRAARKGNSAAIRALLEYGAESNVESQYGWAPLHRAAEVSPENPEAIRALLEHGADIEAQTDQGWTPLHVATLRGNPAAILTLLDHGANIEAEVSFGVTPLHWASTDENQAVIFALLAYGPNLMAMGGFDVSVIGTPLHHAARSNENPAVVRALLDYGAEIEAQNMLREGTPLHWAANDNVNLAVIQLLLARGANIEARDEYGRTPLHKAAFNENPAVVRLLLVHGANAAAHDVFGQTSLDMAIRVNNAAAAQMLRAEGEVRAGGAVDGVANSGSTTFDCGDPRTSWYDDCIAAETAAREAAIADAYEYSQVFGEWPYGTPVLRVVDGDTLEVRNENGEVEHIRLAHVDAPERGCPRFQAATEFVRERVEGKRIRMEKPLDLPNRGSYGRRLREVLVEYRGREINLGDELLAAGLATRYVPGGPDCLPA